MLLDSSRGGHLCGCWWHASDIALRLVSTAFAHLTHTILIFLSSTHTSVLFAIIFVFVFTVYATSEKIGSFSAMHALLARAAADQPVAGNAQGSYLTMRSKNGLIFGVINVIGNFATVFQDQAVSRISACLEFPRCTLSMLKLCIVLATRYREPPCNLREGIFAGRTGMVRYPLHVLHHSWSCRRCSARGSGHARAFTRRCLCWSSCLCRRRRHPWEVRRRGVACGTLPGCYVRDVCRVDRGLCGVDLRCLQGV